MTDDKWLLVALGALIGIPLGMVLFKYLFENQGATAQAQNAPMGANYIYDEQGNLTGYVPVPLTGLQTFSVKKTEPSTTG